MSEKELFKILHGKKILVIDDSQFILSLFKTLFEQQSAEVYTCIKSEDALDCALKFMPDCIISDYEMPNISGPQLCLLLKKKEKLREIPFIILTSKGDDNSLIHAINAGADDYLKKDSNPDVILIKVQAMIRLKMLRDEVVSLREFSAAKSTIATLNHEFNNVVGICIGYLSRLEKLDIDPETLNRIKPLSKALNRMITLIKKITNITSYKEKEYVEGVSMLDLDELEEKKVS